MQKLFQYMNIYKYGSVLNFIFYFSDFVVGLEKRSCLCIHFIKSVFREINCHLRTRPIYYDISVS